MSEIVNCNHCGLPVFDGQPRHSATGMHWVCWKSLQPPPPPETSPSSMPVGDLSAATERSTQVIRKLKKNRPGGPIWREVKSWRDRHNPGYGKHWAVGGSRRLFLECGHESIRKISEGLPAQARCRDCEYLRERPGAVRYGMRWNSETLMPEPVEKELKS